MDKITKISPYSHRFELDTILLDVDGTILDRDTAHLRYIEDLLHRFPHANSSNSTTTDMVEILVNEDKRGRRDRVDYAKLVIRRLPGLNWSAEQFLSDYFERVGLFVQKNESTTSFIAELRRRFRVAAATNGTSLNQRKKLEVAGLSESFDYIAVSGEIGVAKPDPRFFHHVLRAIGANPDRALHVGDDEVNDIHGGSSAGLRTCWLSHGLDFPSNITPPDFIIESINDLPDLVARYAGFVR